MTNDAGAHKPARLYRARAWATFLAAVVFGPLVGSIVLAIPDALPNLRSGELLPFLAERLGAVPLAYIVGGPIAFIAGAMAALWVVGSGNIPPYVTAILAFASAMVPSVLILGLSGILAGFYFGTAAVVAAVIVQTVGTFVAGDSSV